MILAATAQAQGDGWIGIVELLAILAACCFIIWLYLRR